MKKYAPWIAAVIALIVVLALLLVPKMTAKDEQAKVEVTAAPVLTAEPTQAPTEAPAATDAPADAAPAATEEAAAAATDAPASDPAAQTGDETAVDTSVLTAATVNGQAITYGDVDEIAESLMYTYSQYGYDFSDEAMMSQLYQMAMDYAIQMELMHQKAAEWGFDKMSEEDLAAAQAEVDAEWENLINTYISYYVSLPENPTEADMTTARETALTGLNEMGYTKEILMEDYTESVVFEKVEAEIVKDVKVTDEDVQAAFDEAVANDQAAYAEDIPSYEYMTQYYGQTSYYQPEGYRGITHILLNVDEELLNEYQTLASKLEEQLEAEEEAAATATDVASPTDLVTQEDVDAAYAAVIASVQPTIDEINAKLAAGTSFEDLIAEYGQDPGMTQEPNKSQGYAVHKDSVVWDPVFTRAAYSVDNVGDVAEPVLGSYGVHIVKYLRDVPAGPVELTDEMKASLREQLLATKESEAFSAAITEWMNAAEVVYDTAEAQ